MYCIIYLLRGDPSAAQILVVWIHFKGYFQGQKRPIEPLLSI